MIVRDVVNEQADALGNQMALTVFIIDDDEDMRHSLGNILQDTGYEIRMFSSPEEFLAYYRPEFRGCLILDLELPGMNGLELHEALLKQGSSMPFIMITGYGDVPRVIEAFRRGAVDFIEKPFRSAQLLTRVQQMLELVQDEILKEQEHSTTQSLVHSLTPRERELMELLTRGFSTKKAAAEMGISPKTAHVHRSRVLEKMQVESVSQLIRKTSSEPNE